RSGEQGRLELLPGGLAQGGGFGAFGFHYFGLMVQRIEQLTLLVDANVRDWQTCDFLAIDRREVGRAFGFAAEIRLTVASVDDGKNELWEQLGLIEAHSQHVILMHTVRDFATLDRAATDQIRAVSLTQKHVADFEA